MTRYPSITASRAAVGSTSTTMTCAPMPRARDATPRPHIPYPQTTNARPARSRLVARMMASIVDWPVPKRLSNRCFVFASFTLTIGYFRAPSDAIARRRITPVVVSSVPPMISVI